MKHQVAGQSTLADDAYKNTRASHTQLPFSRCHLSFLGIIVIDIICLADVKSMYSRSWLKVES